jgi:hypothetical protein
MKFRFIRNLFVCVRKGSGLFSAGSLLRPLEMTATVLSLLLLLAERIESRLVIHPL